MGDETGRQHSDVPDATGHFGPYGGRFVPEALVAALDELTAAYEKARHDQAFQAELAGLLSSYTGRPSPVTDARRFAEHAGGARVLLKREDLNHTGSHKINNVLGQALLTRDMGKTRVIAETGAGQHGVATATAAALLGLECMVYMGEEDTRRQALNVARMRLLGAEVIAVEAGSQTLKDAINEAMRDWVTNVDRTHYILGTVTGPHPFPAMVRDFQRIIGDEARQQVLRPHRRGCPTRSSPASAAAPTRWASSPRSSTTPTCGCTASRPAARASTAAGTPPGWPVARPACCTAPAPTSCRTRWARPCRRTRSRPGSTTRASARSTPGCTTPAARRTRRSPTPRRWTRSRCSAAPRASSRPSRARTPWPAR